jgi:acetate kinase
VVVLVFNPGSNSVKFDLIEAEPSQPTPSSGRIALSGAVENIGKDRPSLTCRNSTTPVEAASYRDATARALECVGAPGDVRPDLIVYRVVHGGDEFSRPARVDERVIESIERWRKLAPLHNGPALEVIRYARERFPDTPAIAVFDTAFHCRLPEIAYTYAIPPVWNIRRYGFHGVSHRYQLLRYAELVGASVDSVKLVTLHLESGSSAAAIGDGHSIDTSMGFTPLEGLVMGSRCGDLDPAILPYIAREQRLSLDEVEQKLNRECGLLGLSGISNDTRVLMRRLDNDGARLALEVYAYRVTKYVAGYLAVLGGADAVIFSGGIGENTPMVRKLVCDRLRWCGLDLDQDLNPTIVAGDVRITRPGSRIHAWAVHSDEARMLAHEGVTHLATS